MKTKILICIFLFILIVSAFLPFEAEAIGTTDTVEEINIEKDPVITKHKDEESEQWLWDTLMKYTDNNEKITAGILAVFKRESDYRSDAVHNWYLFISTDICKEFVEKIDTGLMDGSTKDYFIEQCHYFNGGFGLIQVWSVVQAKSLYNFARKYGTTTIADAEMQCVWAIQYFKETHPEVWDELLKMEKVSTIARKCAIYLDGASETGQGVIAYYADQLYKKYGTQ